MSPERLAEQFEAIQADQSQTLIPGDEYWASSVDELGARAPLVLWARGASSLLTRPTSDLVTITGARAATRHGEHVASEIASELANAERIVVTGGAYSIDAAAHKAVLAAGGDTIAVMASGVGRLCPTAIVTFSNVSLMWAYSSSRPRLGRQRRGTGS